jgi:hypothetical protein
MSLIKSKERVADHGEVFTPPWMVEAMLNLVKDETERIDSRFLEPACGDWWWRAISGPWKKTSATVALCPADLFRNPKQHQK